MAVGLPEVIYTNQSEVYLHLPGVIVTQKATEVRYLLSDGLGSIRHAVDETATVVAYQEFDPYGNPVAGEGDPYGYTGEWWEESVDLLHLRARWYAPETGTFLSRDKWTGNMGRSQSLNRWSYVEGNPISFTDPFGFFRCDPLTGICEQGYRLCVVGGQWQGAYRNGKPCIVNPSNVRSEPPPPLLPPSVQPTTLADMPAYWWYTSPVVRPTERAMFIVPSPGPPNSCTQCQSGPTFASQAKNFVVDQILAPHSIYVRFSVNAEADVPLPFLPAVAPGVEGEWSYLMIAWNPWYRDVKTFNAVSANGTLSTPELGSTDGTIMVGYANTANLDNLTGSEFCLAGFVAVDAFVQGGIAAARNWQLRGDIKDLAQRNVWQFIGDGVVVDDVTNRIVHTTEIGLMFGGNIGGSGLDGGIGVSPGTNYTWETEPFWED